MNSFFGLLILIISLTSCAENSESYDTIDPAEFNKTIEKRTDIKTAEELIVVYYNFPTSEETPKLEIESQELKNGVAEVTLIHDGMQDDSQKAIKIVMTAKFKNQKWIVQEIKTNRKCYEGRGHTNWGKEWCI